MKNTRHIASDFSDKNATNQLIESAFTLAKQLRELCTKTQILIEDRDHDTVEYEMFDKIKWVCEDYIQIIEKRKLEKDGKDSNRDKGSDLEKSFGRHLSNIFKSK